MSRLVWDLMSIICIVYDFVMAPMEFMEVPTILATFILAWFNRIFWSCDILVSFLTSFTLPDGTEEVRLAGIAGHYVRTWFFADAAMVLADWMEVLLDTAGKASRIIGLFRLLRLVRMFRLKRLFGVIAKKVQSERAVLLANMVQSTGLALGVAHAMACIWLGLGRHSEVHWVAQRGLGRDERLEQYALAMHWALTNYAGSMDLQPQTPGERCYAIACLLCGFLIASWFVSSITSSMTQLSLLTSQTSMQFSKLNKYLQEQQISAGLVRRLQLNAKHSLLEQQLHLRESDVELLALVSEPLRAELHFEIYSPTLLTHPLFERLQVETPRVIQHICHSAVSLMSLVQDDLVFSRGELPANPKMLFVLDGRLSYTQDGLTTCVVTGGQWLCEQVLWTQWVYHGNLQAMCPCRLLALDAAAFCKAASRSATSGFDLGRYATRFVSWQNSDNSLRTDVGRMQDCVRLVYQAYGKGRRYSLGLGSRFSSRRSSMDSSGSHTFSNIGLSAAESP